MRRRWKKNIVLKAIWEARCDLLHDSIPTREQAVAQALARVRASLRVLAYQKLVPSLLLPSILTPRPSGDLAFFKLTWGAVPEMQLLLPRHVPPTSPPSAQ